MTTWSEIARACPIGRGLDSYRNARALDPTHEALDPTDEGNIAANNERQKNAIISLLLAVQSLPASRLLPSKRGKGHLSLDLSKLMLAVNSDYYDLERMKPLFDAVLNEQSDEAIWGAVYELLPPSRTLSSFPRTPWSHNTSNCANPVKDCKDVGAPKKTQSMSTSASRLCCSFLQLPPEIRCMIYRILLRSKHRIRMVPPPQDEYHIPRPNKLYPSILGTCRLIHLEAQYVLYGENTFHAHRINENNHSAALIRRANYRIGLYKREDGEDEARKLAEFLRVHRELRLIEVKFGFDLIKDPSIYELVCQAVHNHRHLMDIKILSPFGYSGIGWSHSWRLWRMVKDQAHLLQWLQGE